MGLEMAVFITRTRILAVPLEAVREAFLHAPGEWMPTAATTAAADGVETISIGALGVSANVDVSLVPQCCDGGKARLAMRWSAHSATALFPVLDADLELAPSGAEACRLVLTGAYRPPLGPLGRAVDGLLLHHVAEQDIEGFLSAAAAGLEQQARNHAA